MSRERQAAFWVAVLTVLALGLWLLRSILLPFVLGMAAGFLLDPLVAWLERRGVRRSWAASVIVAGSYASGALVLLLVVPVAVEQAGMLLARLPEWLGGALDALRPLAARLRGVAGQPGAVDLSAPVEGVMRRAGDLAGDVASGLLTQGWALANLVGLLAITPLVAFYLLRDWPRMVAAVDEALPRAHADTLRVLARESDRLLASFVRGQAIVSLGLAAFYAVALSAIGLESGLLIGLGAGLVSFVPYVGTAAGLAASVGQAVAQSWPALWLPALAFAIFVLGQLVTDYVLTPRLVGERVGLHPLWVIFAVFAGGALFGVVGMLIAVPASAVIGVLVRHGLGHYKASALYRGQGGDAARDDQPATPP